MPLTLRILTLNEVHSSLVSLKIKLKLGKAWKRKTASAYLINLA